MKKVQYTKINVFLFTSNKQSQMKLGKNPL